MQGGETEKSPSAWTIDSAMHHILAILAERDHRYQQRFDAQERAIAKSEEATEKRFESVNEFRAQLSDQAIRFMPRTESVARHDATAEKINDIDSRQRQDVQLINSRLDLTQGGSAGADKFRATLFAMLAAAAAVVGIAFAIAGRN